MPIIDLMAGRAGPGIGAKAQRVHWLARHGHRVPRSWAIVPPVPAEHLAAIVEPGRRYAVRSSANLEDGADFSFAGQFRTELDVPAEEVTAAVARVRASVDAETVASYLRATGVDPARLRMAIIVQEMVTPVVSGVVFSRNPMTGLSETVVEAVAGRGDALVGEGVTPWRWMHRWGEWTERPDGTPLPEPVLESVVATAAAIEDSFGAPVDLEWVWDGETLFWVQLRDITGLDTVNVYSNRIAREVLPGIIKPLVWSVNVPLVNGAWIELFTEAIGPNRLRPEDLARPFGYRAYFNMGTIGDIFETLGLSRETLELLLGFEGPEQPSFRPGRRTVRHLPRIARTGWRLFRYRRAVEEFLPVMEPELQRLEQEDLAALDEPGLLAAIDRLFTVVQRAAYVNIVVPLLQNAYYGGLRRRLSRLGVDVTRVRLTGAGPYDPGPRLDDLHRRFETLDASTRERVRRGGYPELVRADPELGDALDRFLDRFGHFSDSGNDFSQVPWRADRDRLVRLVADHHPRTGDGSRLEWPDAVAEAGWLSRVVLDAWYRRARDFRGYRDAVSFQYTRGYGLFHDRFLELGSRLAARGVLDRAEDVWYLDVAEVRRLVAGDDVDARELVRGRRAEIAELGDAAMPEVIFGDRFVPLPAGDAPAGARRGIPTSRGVYRGPLRVVRHRDDFERVEPGDVLVVPYSDVGWTPLFARAGAVVAEAGGILSHSSIIAREYGIPCVVSVAGACRLPDGAPAVVDGYAGTVTVEMEE